MLSSKEMIYLLNVSARDFLRRTPTPFIESVSAAISSVDNNTIIRIVSMEFEELYYSYYINNELELYLTANPTHLSCIDNVIKDCYKKLNIIRFYNVYNNNLKCYCLRQGFE